MPRFTESRSACAGEKSFENTAAQHPPPKTGAGREAYSLLVPCSLLPWINKPETTASSPCFCIFVSTWKGEAELDEEHDIPQQQAAHNCHKNKVLANEVLPSKAREQGGGKNQHLMRGVHPDLGGRETTASCSITHRILLLKRCCRDSTAHRLLSRGSPSTLGRPRETSDSRTLPPPQLSSCSYNGTTCSLRPTCAENPTGKYPEPLPPPPPKSITEKYRPFFNQ